MIPYWQAQKLTIIEDTLEFHVFGILVGIGVLLGTWLFQRESERRGLSPRVAADLGLWIIILAFIFAHWVSLFAYFPERVFGTPCPEGVCPRPDAGLDVASYVCGENGRCNDGDWTHIVQFWNGISSYGGFLGATLALLTYFRMRRIVVVPRLLELVGGAGQPGLKYIDPLAYAFSLSWVFGRAGCFSAHDHVGRVTGFLLAVNFPDGWRAGVPAVPGVGEPGFTPRFDLGLLEMIFALSLFLFFHFWARKQTGFRPGWLGAVFILAYAPVRFFLDSLRATDIGEPDRRYLSGLLEGGLTPGQIGSIVLVVVGSALWVAGGRAMRDSKYMASFGDRLSDAAPAAASAEAGPKKSG